MKKPKVILPIAGSVLITATLLGSNVFADAKKGLHELVMEHEVKIDKLEKKAENVTASNQPLTEEMKQTLVKEYMYGIDYMLIDHSDADMIKKMNLVDYKLVKKNGENVFQLYFEDEYEWVVDANTPYGSDGAQGRFFAINFTNKLITINTLYNVDVRVEFYEHGEQVKAFIK
jgi:hypothetical protein